MRSRLPDGVRMYTGDDMNYDELILGDGCDGRAHSDALLGIFDAIATDAAGGLPPGVSADRHALAPRLPAPDVRVQDGNRLPGLLERPSDALSDDRGRGELALPSTPRGAVPARRLRGAAARSGARGGTDAAGAGAGRGGVRTGGPLAPGEPTPGASPGLTPSASPGFSRLSLNQITVERASLEHAVEACARHGVPYIAVWRHKLAEAGLERAVRLVRDAGVRVSSVCRGGMFPAASRAEREARIEDNRRAVDEAAALGAEVLVLVCGAAPLPDKDIAGARRVVADGIAALIP